MKLFAPVLMFLALPSLAIAEQNIIQRVAPSIHKVITFKNRKEDDVSGYATAFFAKLPDGKVLGITNNHVCAVMIGKGRETFLRLVDSKEKINYDKEALKVDKISMAMGEDICFFSVKGEPGSYLELGNDVTKLDKISVVGYPGMQFNIIAEDGYSSDSITLNEAADLVKCLGPVNNEFDYLMCNSFKGVTLSFHDVSQFQITPNIGPGFSGSPVIDPQGKVIGLIARYVEPTEEYTNGHGLFIPVSKIKKYAEKVELLSPDDNRVILFNFTRNVGIGIHEFLEYQQREREQFIKELPKRLMRESNGP